MIYFSCEVVITIYLEQHDGMYHSMAVNLRRGAFVSRWKCQRT